MRQGITQSAVDLFAAYGIDFVADSPTEPSKNTRSKLAFFSIAGFGGPHFSGFVALGATESVLRRSNHTTSSLVDWMAELANQFLGRIKNRLLREGFSIHRVPPAVMQGEMASTLASTFLPRTQTPPIALSAEGDSVLIWMASEPSTDGEEGPDEPATDVLAEGELLLF